jgi:Pyridoxamine 5'-phosphate oxidase
MADRMMEELDENECLQLIGSGGIGRIGYAGRFGPAVLPVNYQLRGGAIVFRTAQNAPLDEDLRTGIAARACHRPPGARAGETGQVRRAGRSRCHPRTISVACDPADGTGVACA